MTQTISKYITVMSKKKNQKKRTKNAPKEVCLGDSQSKSESQDFEDIKQDQGKESQDNTDFGTGVVRERVKFQNFISAIILLFGLLVGSIFVDVAQLVAGEGFSRRALDSTDLFRIENRTWVAYDEPIVPLTVVVDTECDACKPNDALVFLRRYVPTLQARGVDVRSSEGKQLLETGSIKTLPAFVFDPVIEDTAFYVQARTLFTLSEGGYVLNIAQLGLPTGRYVALPKVSEDSLRIGGEDAVVQIIQYCDIQSQWCQVMHGAVKKLLSEYTSNEVQFVHKNLPMSIHAQSRNAALAVECANEQGLFSSYLDSLYTNQTYWQDTTDTAAFKQYAIWLGAQSREFNQCLDAEKYAGEVDADITEAQGFGIADVPSTFVGSEFFSGVVDYDMLKVVVEAQLAEKAKQ